MTLTNRASSSERPERPASAQSPGEDSATPVCSNFECENPGTRLCSGCKSALYCSKHCQTENWESHVWKCKVPIHTGHYLRKACIEDTVPTHQQTRVDYGFERAAPYSSQLIGLYQGLWHINPELNTKELNRWRKNGLLVSKIKETFESVPEQSRGGYYPWFLRNQWILDGSAVPDAEGPQAQVERMKKKAWDRIGKDLTLEMPQWSDNKKNCFTHYAMALSNSRPPPTMDLWVQAGYCVARNDYEENQICLSYHQLFERCSFEEYCNAYNSGAVYSMLEKYEALSWSLVSLPALMYNSSGILDNFRHVLASSPTMHESVWSLRQCIDDGIEEFQPARSVVADYGFINCKSVPEREALVEIYRAAFRSENFDALKMHEACIQGKTFEYVTQFVPLKKEEIRMMRRLMKNVYPLRSI